MPLIIFDLDNTLVDRAAVFRSWAEGFAREHGLDERQCVSWFVEADADGVRPRPVLFEAARGRFGLRESVEDLVAGWWPAYLSLYTCSGDTRDALTLLRRRGWRIGIATNGHAEQEDKIRQAGLDVLVDGWCVSSIAGCAKPDARIFELAAARCGATLKGAWMVGDSGPADIGGAVAAGIRSAWISRGAAWTEAAYRPTIVTDSVGDAVRTILATL